ncbi:unnamed protein product [Peronospora farinosa]|uniref:Glycoside hydrolase family 5 domain-containing protein n=1 Tax=Peronospora farinosa TaxID=134698 RepID=A0ABN8BYS0_9STRA|nr:unnamed protein product [Peronospora farinosa]
MGMKPVNEPWKFTPIKVLKEYYWKSYKRVKALALLWKFIIHDSFRFGLAFWADFLLGCPNIAFDMHIYQAWNSPGTIEDFFSNACQQKYVITKMEDAMMPVIVGEWSIGTDNSAMWLIGFNDNLPGFPKVQCHMVDCPINSTYLSDGFQVLLWTRLSPFKAHIALACVGRRSASALLPVRAFFTSMTTLH